MRGRAIAIVLFGPLAAGWTVAETGAMPLQSPVEKAGVGINVPPPDTWRHRTGSTQFVVRIENVSAPDATRNPHGTPYPAGMSHGVYAVYSRGAPIFAPGEPADPDSGLEALAEDGNVRPMQAALWLDPNVVEAGIFYQPVGATKDEELWPGKVYEFSFTANPGDKLSFATMLMQSNDAIYAPEGGGIDLFDEAGRPISGDITDRIALWDAGTEKNQAGGFGPDAGMFQSGQDTGPDETRPVRPMDDGYPYVPATEVLKVTITPR